jgi:hypothetical protein
MVSIHNSERICHQLALRSRVDDNSFTASIIVDRNPDETHWFSSNIAYASAYTRWVLDNEEITMGYQHQHEIGVKKIIKLRKTRRPTSAL